MHTQKIPKLGIACCACAPRPSQLIAVRALPGHHGAVWDVEYSAASPSSFASAGQDGAVKLWDERAKTCAATLPHASPMFCVAWLPGAAPLLAAAGEEGDVLVYDVRSPQVRPRPGLAARRGGGGAEAAAAAAAGACGVWGEGSGIWRGGSASQRWGGEGLCVAAGVGRKR